jgi:hypothetical protein
MADSRTRLYCSDRVRPQYTEYCEAVGIPTAINRSKSFTGNGMSVMESALDNDETNTGDDDDDTSASCCRCVCRRGRRKRKREAVVAAVADSSGE